MDITAIINALLTLLAGIGVFLIACQMMSSNLESASSEKLKSLFSKASGSKLLGVGIGTLGTAAIQSSGATTVMTIGFVNAGIISLTQAATIIYGGSLGMAVRLDFQEKERFTHTEQLLNYMNQTLIGFVSRLNSGRGLSPKDRAYLSTTYRSVRDLERIGDYAENIVEYAMALESSHQEFSDDAKYEISQLKGLLHRLYDDAVAAYRDEDFAALSKANEVEEQIDDYTKSMEEGHIARMEKGICTPSVGAQYLELSSNAERIADHLINVAKTIRSL